MFVVADVELHGCFMIVCLPVLSSQSEKSHKVCARSFSVSVGR